MAKTKSELIEYHKSQLEKVRVSYPVDTPCNWDNERNQEYIDAAEMRFKAATVYGAQMWDHLRQAENSRSILKALDAVVECWSESRPGGMICNPNVGGGIIDSALVSGEWFVVFNDGRETIEGFESRDDAVEAYAIEMRKTAEA